MATLRNLDFPYALIPDWENFPDNCELRTFEYAISLDIVDKLVDELMNPDNEMVVDGVLISKVDKELYNTLLDKAKEIEPNWKDYVGLEIYIPEAIHFIAKCKQMMGR